MASYEEEQEVDLMLLNLKNLAELKEGNKLRVASDCLLEVDDSLFPSIQRAYNGDSREVTLTKLEELFSQIFTFVEKVILMAEAGQGESIPEGVLPENGTAGIFCQNPVQLLQRFQVALRCALTGLENLRQTYYDSITTRSTLTLLIEKVKIKIDKLDGKLRL